jgi:hypothetical protein
MRYCGREFTEAEIGWIRQLMADNPGISRIEMSRRFCRQFAWLKPDQGLKDMSCRVAMLRMEKDGLITLPPPRIKHTKPYKRVSQTLFALPEPEINRKAGEFNLRLEITDRKTLALWNEFIDRYHYLRYTPLPGAQIRYFVKHVPECSCRGSGEQILALLGFGAAAWKTAPRDSYVGWNIETRQKNLHLIVNNARFLILPWVRSRNLASRILSAVSKRIASDWEERYRYRPVLMETFVEKARFTGACYKASNWVCVGDTQGRGKLDVHNEYKLPVKSVWLYPLVRNFRQILCGGRV